MQDINVTGYHFHFLSGDKKSGGHVLTCVLEDVQIQIEGYQNFELILPADPKFGNMSLHTEKSDVDAVEKKKN